MIVVHIPVLNEIEDIGILANTFTIILWSASYVVLDMQSYTYLLVNGADLDRKKVRFEEALSFTSSNQKP